VSTINQFKSQIEEAANENTHTSGKRQCGIYKLATKCSEPKNL